MVLKQKNATVSFTRGSPARVSLLVELDALEPNRHATYARPMTTKPQTLAYRSLSIVLGLLIV